MLSKSKGQILRIAAVLETLFQVDADYASKTERSNEISDSALKAAIDYVQTSIQHTCYMAGRTTVAEEVEMCNAGAALFYYTVNMIVLLLDIPDQHLDNPDIAGYTLLLPGKKLDLSTLVKAKKFKNRGNKPAAIDACKKLEEAGIGSLIELGSARGTNMVSIIIHIRA